MEGIGGKYIGYDIGMSLSALRVLVAGAGLAAVFVPATSVAQPRPVREPEQIAPPADVAAVPADATRLPNGLAYKMLAPAKESRSPARNDLITVEYTGWSADGKTVDSTVWRKKPSTFLLDRVLPGWTEGVSTMGIGEKRRWWMPEGLTYKGASGRPKGTIVFDIELLAARTSPLVPPPDVAAPPPDARKTPSGIAYKILREGPVGVRPKSSSRVVVHYTGWTTDGKMFDSSVMRGEPATLSLTDVIQGWTEGMQLMTPGEIVRFWIPQNLAYKGEPGSPKGMLVFEVELISVEG